MMHISAFTCRLSGAIFARRARSAAREASSVFSLTQSECRSCCSESSTSISRSPGGTNLSSAACDDNVNSMAHEDGCVSEIDKEEAHEADSKLEPIFEEEMETFNGEPVTTSRPTRRSGVSAFHRFMLNATAAKKVPPITMTAKDKANDLSYGWRFSLRIEP